MVAERQQKKEYMMKRTYILVLILCLLTTSFAFASDKDDFSSEAGQLRIGENRRLSVTLYKQDEDNFCGPACLQMAIKYLENNKISQYTLAQGITDASGTIPISIANRANQYVGAGTYRHIGTWETTTKGSFYDNLRNSIIEGKPVFCQVKTRQLPNYVGATKNYGHWVLATGYVIQAGATTQIAVYYNDPINKDQHYGSFSTYLETMEAAIDEHSGWYVSS